MNDFKNDAARINQQYYDAEIIPVHFAGPSTYTFEHIVKPLVKELVTKDDKVILDFGCGHGIWRFIFPPDKTYIGFDVTTRSFAKKKGGNFHFVVADGGFAPFKDNSFDFVLCNMVLEHVEEDQKALSELQRVLKKGKYVIITVPTDDWSLLYNELPYLPAKLFGRDLGHGFNYYSKMSLVKTLQGRDFEVKCMGFYLGFFGTLVQAMFTYPPVLRWYLAILVNKLIRRPKHIGMFSFSSVYGAISESELKEIRTQEIKSMSIPRKIYRKFILTAFLLDQKIPLKKGGELYAICRKSKNLKGEQSIKMIKT